MLGLNIFLKNSEGFWTKSLIHFYLSEYDTSVQEKYALENSLTDC